MKKDLLALLVCPVCQGQLTYLSVQNELQCRVDRLAFPIRADIPIMLIAEARSMTPEECI